MLPISFLFVTSFSDLVYYDFNDWFAEAYWVVWMNTRSFSSIYDESMSMMRGHTFTWRRDSSLILFLVPCSLSIPMVSLSRSCWSSAGSNLESPWWSRFAPSENWEIISSSFFTLSTCSVLLGYELIFEVTRGSWWSSLIGVRASATKSLSWTS